MERGAPQPQRCSTISHHLHVRSGKNADCLISRTCGINGSMRLALPFCRGSLSPVMPEPTISADGSFICPECRGIWRRRLLDLDLYIGRCLVRLGLSLDHLWRVQGFFWDSSSSSVGRMRNKTGEFLCVDRHFGAHYAAARSPDAVWLLRLSEPLRQHSTHFSS